MFKEFREFINRGNVVDLAVAVIIAAAFGKIVTTLVDAVLMPPIGMLLGNVDFSGLFINLSDKPRPASLAAAKAEGIPVIAYGQRSTTSSPFSSWPSSSFSSSATSTVSRASRPQTPGRRPKTARTVSRPSRSKPRAARSAALTCAPREAVAARRAFRLCDDCGRFM